MRICPACRRVMQGWASNFCSSCGYAPSPTFYSEDAISSTPASKKPQSGIYVVPPKMNLDSFLTNQKRAKERKRQLHYRLLGFNLLLEDIFGKPTQLGHVLMAHGGVSEDRVKAWRHNENWLGTYLTRIEYKLIDHLAKVVGKYNTRILDYWYGLSRKQATSVQEIATELKMTLEQVEETYKVFLEYLCSERGQVAVTSIIVMATQEEGEVKPLL